MRAQQNHDLCLRAFLVDMAICFKRQQRKVYCAYSGRLGLRYLLILILNGVVVDSSQIVYTEESGWIWQGCLEPIVYSDYILSISSVNIDDRDNSTISQLSLHWLDTSKMDLTQLCCNLTSTSINFWQLRFKTSPETYQSQSRNGGF